MDKKAYTILQSTVTALEQSVKHHKASEHAQRQSEAALRVQTATLSANIENLIRSLSERSLSNLLLCPPEVVVFSDVPQFSPASRCKGATW